MKQKRHTVLDRKTRNAIKDVLELRGEIDVEDGIEIVLPQMNFDPDVAKRREARRLFTSITASMKDERGVRKSFATDHGLFVNLEVTRDLDSVNDVITQLDKKYRGFVPGMEKAIARQMELQGLRNTDQVTQ